MVNKRLFHSANGAFEERQQQAASGGASLAAEADWPHPHPHRTRLSRVQQRRLSVRSSPINPSNFKWKFLYGSSCCSSQSNNLTHLTHPQHPFLPTNTSILYLKYIYIHRWKQRGPNHCDLNPSPPPQLNSNGAGFLHR